MKMPPQMRIPFMRRHFLKMFLTFFHLWLECTGLRDFETEVKFHGRNEQNRKGSHEKGRCEPQRTAVLWQAYAGSENDDHDRQGTRHDVAVR
jgi:hypothetical protein